MYRANSYYIKYQFLYIPISDNPTDKSTCKYLYDLHEATIYFKEHQSIIKEILPC